ncbi:MAG: cytochrome c biogenesis protein ResB [Syntrophales bacterium]|nr:cytochrome c biogenesis protein ResB [Syntrophales bacterium]HPB69423.1 cytochrome c biogenesis protein ResB [Syntrophales bacterium]HQN25684.1 cytochrome c biogenesis protein ResB [Syntrophales bacterium]
MTDPKSPLRSFFSSVRLALFLLIAIALTAIAGTVIPQGSAAPEFAARLTPSMAALLQKLQLFDVFHSLWFLILILLLTVNLVVCSWSRFPASLVRWRQARSPAPAPEGAFDRLSSGNRIRVTGEVPAVAAMVETRLRKRVGPVRTAPGRDATILSAQKGAASHFGVYLVHLGVLVVMAGVVLGFFLGFEGSLQLGEGEAADAVRTKAGGVQRLDFTVRCDRFVLEHYTGGMPKTYRSDLTFLKGGKVLRRTPVLVNHPVTFGGYRFYQASYGTIPGGGATLALRREGRALGSVEVGVGAGFNLPGGEGRVEVQRIEENLMHMGPAVKLLIRTPGEERPLWVFQHLETILKEQPNLFQMMPMLNPAGFTPYEFALARLSPRYYTGLQVARDPGAPVVAAGAVLLVVGFLFVFFYAHRQVWVRVAAENGAVEIAVTGRTNRDRVGLEREIASLLKGFREGGAG